MKNLLKIIPIFFLLAVIVIPIFVNAAGLIPDCGQYNNCGYNELLQLVNNIINWIIIISVPVAAGVFAWAGIVYMTTGIADKKSYAKGMMWKVFVGFVFILAAWIIVGTIAKALLKDTSIVPVQININKSINFYV